MTTKRPYDLEERTFEFARDIRFFVKTLPYFPIKVFDVHRISILSE